MQLSLVEKYRIKSYADIIGQDKAVIEVKNFLKDYPKKRGLLIYGPAGTGKTSLALAAARENDFDVLELNASDLRNRQKLEQILKPATEQQSLFKKGKVILMDEVDGVTGTDIGGIPELVNLLVTTRHPIIMTCNDVWQSKMSPLRAKCKMVEMKSLPIPYVAEILQKVAEKEKIVKDAKFFQQVATRSQGDIRAAINDLQAYRGVDSAIDLTETRDVEDSIYNILKKILKERQDFLTLFDTTRMSLDEILLWLEENIPKEYKNEVLAKAFHALGNADVFRGRIYKKQSWRFLVYQNIFQSAGVSYAKPGPIPGFTKYEPPKRILKIWINNQKMAQKKSISRKYAHETHCSAKQAMKDFALLRMIMRKYSIQKQLDLSEEEMDFLTETKKETPAQ